MGGVRRISIFRKVANKHVRWYRDDKKYPAVVPPRLGRHQMRKPNDKGAGDLDNQIAELVEKFYTVLVLCRVDARAACAQIFNARLEHLWYQPKQGINVDNVCQAADDAKHASPPGRGFARSAHNLVEPIVVRGPHPFFGVASKRDEDGRLFLCCKRLE